MRHLLWSMPLAAALLAAGLACNLGRPPSAMAPPGPTSPGPTPPAMNETPEGEPAPTAAEPVIAPTAPRGWLTYRNQMLGYEFDYPPEAALITVGVTGYPTEQLPPGLEPGQFVATLEATYPEALCAGVEIGIAYLYVGAPAALGGEYSAPCGVSGVGNYELRRFEEPVLIGSERLTATGDRGYSLSVGLLLLELAIVEWRGFRFNYGGDWDAPGMTLDDYLADKAVIAQVLASWRWLE